MKKQWAVACIALTFGVLSAKAGAQGQPHTLAVAGDQFTLDGKPFHIIAGAIHYPRIPRAYWRDRLKKARVMGLNTVETYAFWNVHEPVEGQFDFTGQNDIAEFIREAQQEGLYVVLRPGPYVCAEWEWGGYPAWLLRDPHMVVRSSYPPYLAAAQRYLDALGTQLAPLQSANGGPIIAVQVENEYGSYGADHAYMEQVHQAILHAGFTKALLYTADGPEQQPRGSLPGLPVGVNFGPGEAKNAFATLDNFRPGSVHFNSEYWDGWFDHWGAKHETRDTATQATDLEWMLQRGYSVNLYMFAGGTSFGWMNGSNSNGQNADGTTGAKANYEPDVTSYDYDVPVAETGELRPKYFEFRRIIQSVTHETLPDPPSLPAAMTLPPVKLQQGASLWTNLPTPVRAAEPKTMEDLGQNFGYVLYRTTLPAAATASVKLHLPIVHDYALVYLDGELQGAVDRRLQQTTLQLKPHPAGARLDLLVENTGRVNYGRGIPGERAGLLATPTLAGAPLHGWQSFSLPMTTPGSLPYAAAACTGPCFYRASFTVAKPADTFLDTGNLAKGVVWVNGQPLGRFWQVGPQRTLYLPGPWLHAGQNEIVIFDLDGHPGRSVAGLPAPVLDAPVRIDPLSAASH